MRKILLLLIVFGCKLASAQLAPLTVEKIMRDPKWIGSSPSNVAWSQDGKYVFFSWNPTAAPADSVYYITTDQPTPRKASPGQALQWTNTGTYQYNRARTAFTFSKNGDIFFGDVKTGTIKQVTSTTSEENSPRFSFNDTRIVYNQAQNLYAWDISSGATVQLTNLRNIDKSQGSRAATTTPQEEWLKTDQLNYFDILRSRKLKREQTEAYNKSLPKESELREINLDGRMLFGLGISADGRFINYRLYKPATNVKTTIVPAFVTESGFTTDLPSRSKVGSTQGSSECFVYDSERDTVYAILIDSIPGIRDAPDYVKDYPAQQKLWTEHPANRKVDVEAVYWSPTGKWAVLDIFSQDNKDRWLMRWDTATQQLHLLDRQRNEAWIGGPGNYAGNTGWIDDNTLWYRSETSGFSHLYSINLQNGEKRQLTKGNYEVQRAQLSLDKKSFYITTNEVHPGEQQFYRLDIASGKMQRITTMTGANQVSLSPDQRYIAFLYSYTNKPWELYLQANRPGAPAQKITNSGMSTEFASYPWRDPEVITFTARDGAQVYARVYKPSTPAASHPGVLFVHGAGYLQNAHKWWSDYFREYMFNNLLADRGYYVMDIDYRGSAGYGRDWRTGIYRHMGGKDLDDNVDAIAYMVKNFGVNPKNIGLYGGSYGGFLTLMALFTQPDVFHSGAALRPVTDWAQYNHGYTSNILNEPYNDSLAYRRSSPLYFAEGLKGNLLICHGMMDLNVHFQDAVKLTQRLIELGKDNWQIAPYPMEDHGFVEPSSWTDEYKRILHLFETTLKQ